MSARRRLAVGAALLASLIVAGTAGYMIIEGWSLLDAVYQTVTTISTVGFREVEPLSDAGRLFTIILIFLGVGSMLYTVTIVAQVVVEGEIIDALGIRRQRVRIEQLRDHYILCGAGRVGLEIAREFQARGVAFVVLDPAETAGVEARRLGYLHLAEDATREEALVQAGVKRARAVIAAVRGDAENTYITLTARALNQELFIVARADAHGTEARLKQAGADRVISPLSVGGRRMALSALQPAMVDFMDTLTAGHNHETILAEIEVEPGSALEGQPIAAALSEAPSVSVLAVRHSDGALAIGPRGSVLLHLGDQLIVLGDKTELEALSAGSPRPSHEAVGG